MSTLQFSRADVRAYAKASGDTNPIHLDDAEAQAVGLPNVVAHGMLTFGRLTSWALSQWPEGTTVMHLKLRFLRPVPPETPVSIEAKDEALASGERALHVKVLLPEGEVAAKGIITGRFPVVHPAGKVSS